MTYSYAQPVSGVFPSDKDEVRFLLGDTTPAAPFSLTDEEIEYLLADGATPRAAAANAASRMATRYTREAGVTSKSVGNLSLTVAYSEQAAAFRALATELRAGSDLGIAAGPAYYTPVPIQFSLGQFDNAGN